MATLEQLRRAAGAVIVGGFEGTSLPAEVADDLRQERLGGVVLFARNIVSAAQVAALTAEVQACRPAAGPPLFVAVDQEGGRVARLRGIATDLPPAAHLGAIGDPDLCVRAAEVVGSELLALGFNLDFAPVMDVATEPDNPVIGDRSFAGDPQAVARLAGAFAVGLLTAGVVPCAKHFPGHGDTRVDSHVALPVVPHGPDRLRAVEWVPFAAAARAGLPMVMTAHLSLPALDAEHPATFSRALLQGVLREHLGFSGVIVSDDLEMAAVAPRYPIEAMGELGLEAGLDLFLVCRSRDRQRELHEALVEAAEGSSALARRLTASVARVLALRRDYLRSPRGPAEAWRGLLGAPEHNAVVAEIARRYGASRAAGGAGREGA